MDKMLRFFLILSAVYSHQLFAQTQPCESKEFKFFDFWLGNWQVINQANGQVAGTNSIQTIEQGCAISEHWESVTGTSGQSLNYYNPLTKKWRQLWVASGYNIDISGNWNGTSMLLEGEINYYNQSAPIPFRGTWTVNEDGSVRQLFEQFSPSGHSWNIWFDGLYQKLEESNTH